MGIQLGICGAFVLRLLKLSKTRPSFEQKALYDSRGIDIRNNAISRNFY